MVMLCKLMALKLDTKQQQINQSAHTYTHRKRDSRERENVREKIDLKRKGNSSLSVSNKLWVITGFFFKVLRTKKQPPKINDTHTHEPSPKKNTNKTLNFLCHRKKKQKFRTWCCPVKKNLAHVFYRIFVLDKTSHPIQDVSHQTIGEWVLSFIP